jgi:hypothetical protein
VALTVTPPTERRVGGGGVVFMTIQKFMPQDRPTFEEVTEGEEVERKERLKSKWLSWLPTPRLRSLP